MPPSSRRRRERRIRGSPLRVWLTARLVPALAAGRDHPVGQRQRGGEGFLAENALHAVGGAVDDLGSVEIRRAGDGDDLGTLGLEHLPVVRIEGIDPPSFPEVLQASPVRVRAGHQPGSRMSLQDLRVSEGKQDSARRVLELVHAVAAHGAAPDEGGAIDLPGVVHHVRRAPEAGGGESVSGRTIILDQGRLCESRPQTPESPGAADRNC